MNPAAIELAVLIIQEAIKLEPTIAGGIKEFLSKAEPTPEDFAKLRAHTQSFAPFKVP